MRYSSSTLFGEHADRTDYAVVIPSSRLGDELPEKIPASVRSLHGCKSGLSSSVDVQAILGRLEGRHRHRAGGSRSCVAACAGWSRGRYPLPANSVPKVGRRFESSSACLDGLKTSPARRLASARTWIQRAIQADASAPIGPKRSRRPFPRIRATPCSRSTSATFKPTNSPTRRPPPYNVSNIARSRTPNGSIATIESSSSIAWSTRNGLGNRFGCLGFRNAIAGSTLISPLRLRKRKNERSDAKRRESCLLHSLGRSTKQGTRANDELQSWKHRFPPKVSHPKTVETLANRSHRIARYAMRHPAPVPRNPKTIELRRSCRKLQHSCRASEQSSRPRHVIVVLSNLSIFSRHMKSSKTNIIFHLLSSRKNFESRHVKTSKANIIFHATVCSPLQTDAIEDLQKNQKPGLSFGSDSAYSSIAPWSSG